MAYDRKTALNSELKAIYLWNNLSESDPNDEIYAAGFECRQKRTAEIMAEISRDDDHEQKLQFESTYDLPVCPVVLCTLAHDLQNKLSVIIGQCDLLSENASVTVECKKRLQSIRDKAGAMSEIIKTSTCPGGMR